MTQADRVLSTPRTRASEFLTTINRIHLARMMRAAEHDGLVPPLAAVDHPETLGRFASDLIGASGRHVTIDVEG